MARPSLGQVRAISDYQTTYNWIMQVITPPSGVAGFPASETLNVRCSSTAVPILSNTKLTANVRGHKAHQPGIHEYSSNIVLTFVEGVDNLIKNWIKNWREACWLSEIGTAKTKLEVEATIKLLQLNRADVPNWSYLMKGCFLEAYTAPELTSENGLWFPTVTLSLDSFIDSAV